MRRQLAAEIIDVGSWSPDPDYEFAPQGVKPKRILKAPTPPPADFIKPDHRYLFKYASNPEELRQAFSEIIAYELSKKLDVEVPPTFLAVDSLRGHIGCLIEFFYGYEDERFDTRFVHAVDLFQHAGVNINEAVGSLRQNVALSRAYKAPAAKEWWRKTIVFDALIGNTDRHAENWGFLVARPHPGEAQYWLSPVYDNGTSLGWRIPEDNLAKWSTTARLEKYVSKGRHHYGWLTGDKDTAVHHVLCAHFFRVYGDPSGTMQSMIQLTDSDIQDVLQWAVDFESPVKFTPERAAFVEKLVAAKRTALQAALDN
tara:strand:- start:1352 stop:2290 length:939 start_codon:yes stop_codon:yes gene_type:complete